MLVEIQHQCIYQTRQTGISKMIIKGKIVDLNGEPQVGANVFISDSSGNVLNPPKGVTADVDGKYKLNVEAGGKTYITASFVGMEKLTKLADKAYLDFILAPAKTASLNTVTVYEKRKKDYTALWIFLSLAGLLAIAGTAVSLKEQK